MELLDRYLEIKGLNYKDIEKDAKVVSSRYRNNLNTGNVTLTKESEALAYAFSRMPATYEVVKRVIEKTFEKNDFDINSLTDIGAGTGSASIAINELLNLKQINCFEKEKAMIKIRSRNNDIR